MAPQSLRQLRLITFNIRCATAGDGDDAWAQRRGLAGEVLGGLLPDVVGLQECHWHQAEDLLAALPGYRLIGVGRDDGRRSGEMTAILYRADRLAVAAQGHFWLSETPEVPGSRSWGSAWVRMCTWAAFRANDERDPGDAQATFHVFNTHLDNESVAARERGAELIRTRLMRLGEDVPALLIGDFNAPAGAPPYDLLTCPTLPHLSDTYRAQHPTPAPDENTFHAFTGQTTGPRIDWILVTPHWRVTQAWIDRTHRAGRYPSDHFPVVADVVLMRG